MKKVLVILLGPAGLFSMATSGAAYAQNLPYNYGIGNSGNYWQCASRHAGYYKPDYACTTMQGNVLIDTALWRCQYNDQGHWSPLWGYSWRCDR